MMHGWHLAPMSAARPITRLDYTCTRCSCALPAAHAGLACPAPPASLRPAQAAFGRGLAGASQQRRPIAAPCGGARAVAGRQPVSCASSSKARELLQDCTGLGKVRFIVIGDGAILESVGTFTE